MKEIVVTVSGGFKLSPRSYSNVDGHISITAELEPGDTAEDVIPLLATKVRQGLQQAAGEMLAPLPSYQREESMELLGVHRQLTAQVDDEPDDDSDDYDDEDDYDPEPDEELVTLPGPDVEDTTEAEAVDLAR